MKLVRGRKRKATVEADRILSGGSYLTCPNTASEMQQNLLEAHIDLPLSLLLPPTLDWQQKPAF